MQNNSIMVRYCLQIPNFAVFWTRADGGKWLQLKHVLLPDAACQASPQLTDCLQKAGFCLTSMPADITAMLQQKCPGASCISPELVRRKLVSDKDALKLLSDAFSASLGEVRFFAGALWKR